MVRSTSFFNSRTFPGPGFVDDEVCSLRGESEIILLELFAEPLPDVGRERHDIFPSLPRWGNHQGRDIQRVKQVFTETPLGNGFLEIHLRGGHEANSGVDRLRAAEPQERSRVAGLTSGRK